MDPGLDADEYLKRSSGTYVLQNAYVDVLELLRASRLDDRDRVAALLRVVAADPSRAALHRADLWSPAAQGRVRELIASAAERGDTAAAPPRGQEEIVDGEIVDEERIEEQLPDPLKAELVPVAADQIQAPMGLPVSQWPARRSPHYGRNLARRRRRRKLSAGLTIAAAAAATAVWSSPAFVDTV